MQKKIGKRRFASSIACDNKNEKHLQRPLTGGDWYIHLVVYSSMEHLTAVQMNELRLHVLT